MTCPPHHWLLDTPSPGVRRVNAHCKRCDATSDYRAFEDDGGGETWLETARRTKNALVRPKRHDSYYRYPEPKRTRCADCGADKAANYSARCARCAFRQRYGKEMAS